MVRVVALHLFTRPPVVYLPWIQWLYPGMPEIFFVSGSLIGPALARRRASTVVRARLRRVIPPYLPYAVAIMAVMVITDLRTTNITGRFTAHQALWFVFPFNRPEGSTTRVILWGHLWFITAFLWLIVLSPVLWWLAKRIGVSSYCAVWQYTTSRASTRRKTAAVVVAPVSATASCTTSVHIAKGSGASSPR